MLEVSVVFKEGTCRITFGFAIGFKAAMNYLIFVCACLRRVRVGCSSTEPAAYRLLDGPASRGDPCVRASPDELLGKGL